MVTVFVPFATVSKTDVEVSRLKTRSDISIREIECELTLPLCVVRFSNSWVVIVSLDTGAALMRSIDANNTKRKNATRENMATSCLGAEGSS